jgi:hypothetical protein
LSLDPGFAGSNLAEDDGFLRSIKIHSGTWSLTLMEEHRLRVSENRVLRRTFGPKRDEVTGECRKLHNEELHILYSSPLGRSSQGDWGGLDTRLAWERNAYKVLMAKPEGKRPLRRPRHRWDQNGY